MTFPIFLKAVVDSALHDHQRIALINATNSSSTTYGELATIILMASKWFAEHDVTEGKKVVLAGACDLNFIYLYLALHCIGAVAVPLDPNTTLERFDFVRKSTQPKLVLWPDAAMPESIALPDFASFCKNTDIAICPCDSPISYDKKGPQYNLFGMGKNGTTLKTEKESTLHEHLQSIVEQITPDMLADIMFTSGHTGEPKGALFSHKNLAWAVNNSIKCLGNTKDDVEVCTTPASHSFAIDRLRCVLYAGGTFVLDDDVTNPNNLFKTLSTYKATGLSMSCPSWKTLRKLSGGRISEYFDQLRYMLLGPGPLTTQTKKELADLLPYTHVCMYYCLTEAPNAAFLDFHQDADFLTTVGHASPLCEIAVRSSKGDLATGEVGDICIRGEMVSSGYLDPKNNECAFFADGYFRTGDLGSLDEQGYVNIVGRLKDIINVGDEKVVPEEVEAEINSFPGVAASACVGQPDDILGEAVAAFVVPKNAQKTVDFDDLKKHISLKLESFKIPRTFSIIASLPTSSSGEIQRSDLKGLFSCMNIIPRLDPALKETDPALYYAGRAVIAAPNTKKYRAFYLDLLENRKMYQEVIDLLQNAIKLDPKWKEGWDRISALVNNENCGSSPFMTRTFFMNIAIPSGKPARDFRALYVRTLLKQEAFPEVEQSLSLSLDTDPNWAAGWFYLSRMKLQANDVAEATACLEKAVTLRPDKFEYRDQFLDILLHNEQYDDVVQCLIDGFGYEPKWAKGWECLETLQSNNISLKNSLTDHEFFVNIVLKGGKFSRPYREQYIKRYIKNEEYSAADLALILILRYDPRWALGCYLMYLVKLHIGQKKAAEKYIANATKLRADKFIYRNIYLDILQQNQQYTDVVQCLTDGFCYDPKWAKGWECLENLQKDNIPLNKTITSKDFFENIAVKAGKFSRTYRERFIKQYLAQKEYSNAEQSLSLVLQYDSRWALGYYLMSLVKQHMNQYDAAAEYIAKAIELRPDKFLYRDTNLNILYKNMQYDNIEKCLVDGFNYEPKWANGWECLKNLQKDNIPLNKTLTSKDFFENIAVMGGKFSRAYREQYIKLYLNNEEYTIADQDISLVLQHDPRWATGWYLRSVAKTGLKQNEAVAESLAKAVALRPDVFKYREAYLVAMEAIHHDENMLPVLQEGLERNPGWKEGWKRVSNLLQSKSDSAKAFLSDKFYHEVAVKAGTSGRKCREQYVKILIHNKNLDSALNALKLGLHDDPKWFWGWRTLALIHAENHDYAQANSYAQMAVELQPNNTKNIQVLKQIQDMIKN